MQSYGRYELLERLGRGGMAEVFLARMNGPMHVSRYVAIKRILPEISDIAELTTMFLDEIRLVVHLSHPSIGTVHDFGIEGGAIFLALELIEGVDMRGVLQHALKTQQPIPLECALYIAAQVARALDYAHKACDAEERPLGIVHRDVTPSNIIVSFRGDVKLVDFGIARAASHVRLHHTRGGELKGTIRYMSPEQAGGSEIDGRSDLFSLTTVLLEMVIGHPAFKADSDVQALKLVQQGRAPERDRYAELIPEDVRAIIDRGMQVDRETRFQTGEALATELERALRSRAPAFGPGDLARMMAELCGDELKQHRARMRGFSESGRDDDDSSRRALATAATRAATPPVESPTRAGKSPATPSSAARAEVTSPMGQVETPLPQVPRRRGAAVLAAGAAAVVAAVVIVAARPRAGGDGGATGAPVAATQPTTTQPTATQPTTTQPTTTQPTTTQPQSPPVAPPTPPPSGAATAPITTRTRTPATFGTLNLQSSPWANVVVDGKGVGQTPVVGLRLAAGRHRVTLVNPGLPARTITVVVPGNSSIDRRVTLTD